MRFEKSILNKQNKKAYLSIMTSVKLTYNLLFTTNNPDTNTKHRGF